MDLEKFFKKYLQFFPASCIIAIAVTLIAVKREVAACHTRVFRGANVKLENWRQVTVQYSFCIRQINRDDNRELSGGSRALCSVVYSDRRETHGRVYSHRLSY